jgi:thiamine biosynthesis protein ThiS
MIEVTVNNQRREAPEGTTLAELVARYLAEVNLGPEMVTVALNGTIVPRDDLADHRLKSGDVVEYLLFMGGGGTPAARTRLTEQGKEAALDYAELKKGGWMRQKQPDLFSVRLRVVGGRLKSAQLAKLQEVADRFGRGRVHLTTRQGVEIPFVHLKHFHEVREALREAGLDVGVCGPTVRTITACQGSEVCPHALADTQTDAKRVDEAFFGRSGIPHKFKIGFAGCLNGCTKPAENDLGFRGQIVPAHDPALCTGCGLCAAVCRAGAIQVVVGQVAFEPAKCDGCGECVGACPADAWRVKARGYAVFAGGMFGRTPQIGRRLDGLVRPEDLIKTIERVKSWYNAHGQPGERFGATLNRVGFDRFAADIRPGADARTRPGGDGGGDA